MAMDPSGNLLVTGASQGANGYDYLTIKYTASGLPLWTNWFNGAGNSIDQARAVAVDAAGSVLVTGVTASTNGSYDYATIKYLATGVPVWTNLYNSPGNNSDYADAVAVDAGGNVLVTGYATAASGKFIFATVKYAANGTSLWTNLFDLAGYDNQPFSLAVDSAGNVLVAGYATPAITTPVKTNDFSAMALIKYSSAGVPLWTNLFRGQGQGNESARAVTVDAAGSVYVTGYVTAANGLYDFATIKYSSNGALQWVNTYDGQNGSDLATAIAVGASGEVLVTGYSSTGTGQYDYATVKYSSTGGPVWTNRFSGGANGDDEAAALAVDGAGSVYVTGFSTTTNGFTDVATIKYQNDGTATWTNYFNGPGNRNDYPAGLAVDGSGNIFLAGNSGATNHFSDFVTREIYGPHSPPSILAQPASQVVPWTNDATFTTVVYGVGPYAYQWYFNGAPLSDATNASLIIANVLMGNAGNYQVTITNLYGSTTSAVAALSVIFPTTTAGPDYLATAVNTALTIPAASLLINDQAGTNSNGNSNLLLTAASGTSANGGSVRVHYHASPIWTNLYNGPANGDDQAKALALDSSGNVSVAGTSAGSGITTIKYSGNGSPLWTSRLGSGGVSGSQAIVTDASNAVYVAGYYPGANIFADFVTLKYTNSSGGSPAWVQSYNGAANDFDYGTAVATDPAGDVYVTGYSYGFGIGYDMVLIKYDPLTAAPLWVSRYNGAGNRDDLPAALACDGAGNIYVTGYTSTAAGSTDWATLKFSNSGVPLWTNIYNGTGNRNDQATALAVDKAGNAYVAGYADNGASGNDCVTIKYSPAGSPLWTNVFNGTGNANDQAIALAVDAGGNVYVAGLTTTANGYTNYITLKYSSAGLPLWTNTFDGPGHHSAQPAALSLDGFGNVYVTGAADGGSSPKVFATLMYTTTGVPQWTNYLSGAGNGSAQARALAVDDTGGNVYVTGTADEGGSANDFATVKYVSGADLVYTPPTNFFGVDTFTYVIRDSQGATASATVSVVITNASGLTPVQFASAGYRNHAGYFTLTAPAGTNVVIEASTDLQHWSPVATNAVPHGFLNYTDTLAPNYAQRFFRAQPSP